MTRIEKSGRDRNGRRFHSLRQRASRCNTWLSEWQSLITCIAMLVLLGSTIVIQQSIEHRVASREATNNEGFSGPNPSSPEEPPTALPPVCGAPTSDNPGKEITEPTDDTPFYEPEPTISCAEPEGISTAPEPDVIVLLSPSKAKKLSPSLGGMDCERSDGWQTLYNACDPRPFTDPDVKAAAKKLLTNEQMAFINDHTTIEAVWAFDVKEVADLKEQVAMPTAMVNEFDTVAVYAW